MRPHLFLLVALQVMLRPLQISAQPGGGGATFIPTFSYSDPSTFLLRCDMTGAYLTHDGGRHYTQLNFPGGAHSFAFDPADAKIIYVGGMALHRSADGGKTWRQIYPRREQVVAHQYSGDHAEPSLRTAAGVAYWSAGQSIRCIHVDDADHRRVYFVVGSSLFYSLDAGGSWRKKDFANPLEYVYPRGASIFLFSSDSVYLLNKKIRITDVRQLPTAMFPATHYSAGVLKGTTKPVFYGLGRNGDSTNVWVSTDEGRHWENRRGSALAGIPAGANLATINCAEYDAANAYVVADKVEVQRPLGSPQVFYGVFRTRDAGRHFNWVWKAGGGSGQYGISDAHDAANLRDGWAGKAFGREFIQLMDIGVAPRDGRIAVATDWYRVMKTMDGGQTFTGIYGRSLPGDASASTGLNVTTTYGVHFDPFDRNHIAVSCTDIGYHHSFDGGKSWIRSVTGIPADWVNTCYWVAFDPTIKGKCWGAWSGIHDLPRGKMTRDPQWKTHCRGGIAISRDGGRSWKPSIAGMGSDAPITCVVVDPRSPTGNRTLFATSYNKGVFKSVDDGQTWTLHNKGLGDNTCAFEISLAANGDCYLVVSPTPDFDHQTGARFYSGAVYKSVDGAGSWQLLHPGTTGPEGTANRFPAPGDTLFPSGIGIDPSNPQRLYLACWSDITLSDLLGGAVRQSGGDRRIPMPGGIFRSEDGGHSWTRVLNHNEYVYDVTVDAHHPGRVYANTFTGKALRSDDYGTTWKPIKGYDFQWGHRVIPDENDPSRIYLTTYGSGVLLCRLPEDTLPRRQIRK